MLKAWK